MEEWRNSPENPRNNPKLSPERAQQIADEAVAAGQKWDVQEQINARRKAEIQAECGGGLGKLAAPAKFDALVPRPRCQAGEGAFGTYFVHPSQEYGVKLYRNGDEDDVEWEFDRLGRAWAADVNVPKPLSMNSTVDQYGDVRTQTMVLSHMKGYKILADVYGTGRDIDAAPAIVKVKLAREFRKLHIEGLAHGDIHGGNIMVHPRSKKVAIIDFGYSTAIDDYHHPVHNRTGVQNLMGDLRRLPEFLGYSGINHNEFLDRSKGMLDNIETQANDYSRSWEKFELAVNRYHDYLETDLLWEDRMPRSRFVRSIDQPRIPGLTRAQLVAQRNTGERRMMESYIANIPGLLPQAAQGLGLKPPQLYRALKPERDARLAARKKKPYGTPIPRPATTA